MNGMNTRLHSYPAKWGAVFGLGSLYLISFHLLRERYGLAAILLSAIPVAMAGWYFGMAGGVIAGLFGVIANILLLTMVEKYPLSDMYQPAYQLGTLLLILTGVISGYFRREIYKSGQNETALQRLKETQALIKIGQALSETERTGMGTVLQLIADSARELIPRAEQSVIHLLDAGNKSLIPHGISGMSGKHGNDLQIGMHLGKGVAGQVIKEGITINIPDVTSDSRFLWAKQEPIYRSLLVAPVQSRGKQIGTISVQSRMTYAFSEDEAGLLRALGIQAAIAIENTHLLESLRKSLKEVNALYHISRSMASSLDTNQLLKDVVDLLQVNFGYYYVQIYLRDEAGEKLVMHYGSGEMGEKIMAGEHQLLFGEGIVGHVAETGLPFFTNNVDDVLFFVRHPLLPETRSQLTVPIKFDGKVVGVLDIQDASTNRLTDSDLQLMLAIADQFAVAIHQASLYANLQGALKHEQAMRTQLVQSERLALAGRLLASVSHELNNPLQAIQNALFLLKDELSLSGQARQDLDIILSESERMAALIKRLRTVYRPVHAQDFEKVNLNDVIHDVHRLIATHMKHKDISFEFHPDNNLPLISGISDQLRQVALNLFLNGVEAMPPGGILMVKTETLPNENEIVMCVKDTGPGIAPEILSKIFDPFITGKSTGTGLGLAITYDIVTQHNGRIQAMNDPNGGATFKVWFPAAKKEEG
jgi:signal transduction histidine kinase